MKIDVVTLFPTMFTGPLDDSMVARARKAGILDLGIHDLREYTSDCHRTVDDRPFGGGPGMVIKPEPVFAAVQALSGEDSWVVLMGPAGRPFQQQTARDLSARKHVILLCGSYEGFDERIRDHLAHDELSIGDYVLTNGALPAMVIIDAVTRLLPGVLGDEESLRDESFNQGNLDFPQYTRPADYLGMKVPEVLLSGHHAKIEAWRKQQAHARTVKSRPDLLTGSVGNERHRKNL
jgi:tRNA (guanine37-N1)-methyltransferase